jgi:protein-disulfide isomerase
MSSDLPITRPALSGKLRETSPTVVPGAAGVFWLYFFATLSFFSIAVNGILAVRLYDPFFFHRVLHGSPNVLNDDHVRGSVYAPVTVIEYGDFQCPFCAQVHKELKQLADRGSIRWAYRNYPLPGHAIALPAALAAECAAEQGKFWQFADSVFETHPQNQQDLAAIEGGLGLETVRFQQCLASARPQDHIDKHLSFAQGDLVEATPTMFFNGRRQVGAFKPDQLEQLVSAAR